MSNRVNIIGDTYGRLTVISLHSNINYRKKFYCRCTCGNEVIVSMSHLRTGHTTSCGCLQKDEPNRRKHGDAGTPLYKNYYQMLARCHNPQATTYHKYGAKGRSVCQEWRNSYEAFKKWALEHGYVPGLTLDRKENEGDYTPDNCRWVTPTTQAVNRGTPASNTSGYKGVTRKRNSDRWVARITVEGRRVQVGTFDTPAEAYAARVEYINTHNLTDYMDALKYD